MALVRSVPETRRQRHGSIGAVGRVVGRASRGHVQLKHSGGGYGRTMPETLQQEFEFQTINPTRRPSFSHGQNSDDET